MTSRWDPVAMPLAFTQAQRAFPADPDGFRLAFAALLPIRRFRLLVADPSDFSARLSHVALGAVQAVAFAHAAAAWQLALPRRAAVVMVRQGQLELTEGGRRHRLEAGGPMLVLPAASWSCRSRALNALVLCFDPARLASCLGDGCGGITPVGAPRRLDGDDPLQASLMAAFQRVIPLLDLVGLIAPAQLELLQLDVLLHRLMALLLASEPRGDADLATAALPVGGDPHLAPLLRWIEAHLDRPLGLKDLERASGYSGRTLQYAFKRRFGCSPMRWLRQRRLERARDVLLAQSQGLSMGALAGQVGYGNASAFSRDFRETFGVTPSTLLGRGRS